MQLEIMKMVTKVHIIKKSSDPETQTSTFADNDSDIEKALIRHAGIGLFILQEGRLGYVNQRFVEILGYTLPEALIGNTFWDLVHPEDRKRLKLTDVQPGSFRMLNQTGKPIWVHMKGSKCQYRGRPALTGYLMNVTAWEQCIVSLRESLERYETILNDVDVQLGEMDLDGNLIFINDAGCRIWGLPREDLLGLNYQTYMDQETAQRFYKMYEEVFLTGIPVKNVVLDILDRGGQIRTIEKSVSLIRTEGTITGFRMVTRDITERRQAENKII